MLLKFRIPLGSYHKMQNVMLLKFRILLESYHKMQNVMLLKFRILLHGFMRFRHWFMYITHWFMYVACLFLFLPEQQFTRSHANVFSLQKGLHHLPTCQCLAAAVHIPLAQPPYIKHVIFVYITPRHARMNESRKNRHMHHHMQFHRHIEQLSI